MNISLRAVLFDADGVIIHPYRFRAWLEREHAITPAMTAPFFNGAFSQQCLVGRTSPAHVRLHAVLGGVYYYFHIQLSNSSHNKPKCIPAWMSQELGGMSW